jgi:hypothetical protein
MPSNHTSHVSLRAMSKLGFENAGTDELGRINFRDISYAVEEPEQDDIQKYLRPKPKPTEINYQLVINALQQGAGKRNESYL